jgi:hypothetical protein
MRTLFLLAIAIGVAAARQPLRRRMTKEDVEEGLEWSHEMPREHWVDREFQGKKEFVFEYDAQLMTGVPQSSMQHSGTRMRCLCKMMFEEDTDVLLKLDKCQVAELKNKKVRNPRAMLRLRSFNKITIENTKMEQLKLVVKFKYIKGMISDVQFQEGDQPWSMNIKKGVLNLLQVRLDNMNAPRMEEDGTTDPFVKRTPIIKSSDFFTTYEETMEGRCLTSYTFTRQPCVNCMPEDDMRRVLNVTKSIDFEACTDLETGVKYRPEINYNFRFSEMCPDSSCEKKYQDQEKFL